MADHDDPQMPTDDNISLGDQPRDVEEIRFGRGPGETEMTGQPIPEGHPKGLWVLFITEMWERFSYYGMRALLVLYLIASTNETLANGDVNANPGFGWAKDNAYALYGWYTWAVYLTPIAGGWLADRFLGTHRSLLVGGWIIAAGHITLAMTELFGISAGEAVTMQTSTGAYLTFMSGLLLIIIGTGFFKPCVSVMVGQLYKQGDTRRDSGFTIFYMGINLGAFLSPLIAGTLGQKVGWHWGFGSAAVGMILGLFFYQLYRPKYLGHIGEPPAKEGNGKELTAEEHHEKHRKLTSVDWQRLGVILILAFIGNIFFWTAFEQAGTSLNVFAEQNTARPFPIPEWMRAFLRDQGIGATAIAFVVGILLFLPLLLHMKKNASKKFLAGLLAWSTAAIGLLLVGIGATKLVGEITGQDYLTGLSEMTEFPSTWYQSVNALTIVICAPFFSALWIFLAKHKLNPSTPMKFALGLYLLGLAFISMVVGSMRAEGGALAGPQWLAITYIVYTWGELCLSPVGLSMVTKLAPIRLQSLMMGVWFFSLSLANLLAAQVAIISTKVESGELTFFIPGLPGFYLMLVVFPIAAGVLIMAISPILKKMMHGIK